METKVIGGVDVAVGGTYECPSCARVFNDVLNGEVLKPCPADDCPQHHEEKGLPAPAFLNCAPAETLNEYQDTLVGGD
jgi:hypothetical protein